MPGRSAAICSCAITEVARKRSASAERMREWYVVLILRAELTFALLIFAAAFAAGAISAGAGFRIGNILTPLLGFGIGVRLAVAAASVPHFIGNSVRLWTLR